MNRFKELKTWQEAVDLAVKIYSLTKKFPAEEKYGIVSQINRAVVSISSNIAEGSSRKRDRDYVRFLEMSLGSSFELETQLLLIQELGLVTEVKLSESFGLLEEIQKMLQSFISSIIKSEKITHELEA